MIHRLQGCSGLRAEATDREKLQDARSGLIEVEVAEGRQAEMKTRILEVPDSRRKVYFCRLSRIGTGGFGRIFAAVDDEDRRFVVKKVPLVGPSDPTGLVGGSGRDGAVQRKIPASSIRGLENEVDLGIRFGREIAPVAALAFLRRAYILFPAADTDLLKIFVANRNMAMALSHGQMERILSDAFYDSATQLVEIHRHGVIHNDIKTNNIFVSQVDGHARPRYSLADFGMSYSARDGDWSPPNAVLGAPELIFPIQTAGEGPLFPVDPEGCPNTLRLRQRADIWALGLVAMDLVLDSNEEAKELLPFFLGSEERGDGKEFYLSFERARHVSMASTCAMNGAISSFWGRDDRYRRHFEKAKNLWGRLREKVPNLFPLIGQSLSLSPRERPDAEAFVESIRGLQERLEQVSDDAYKTIVGDPAGVKFEVARVWRDACR